jgi:DNA-binding CsgD family transcriptional regulator
MDNISKVLYHLYETAIHAEPKNFVEDMIELVCQVIEFDGAFYGVGLLDPDTRSSLVIERGYVYQREDSLLNDYISLSAIDPIIKKITNGSQTPFSCAPERYYEKFKLPELQRFATRHRVKNLLIHGHFPALEQTGRWLALFRDTNFPFKSIDAFSLKSLWAHLYRAIQINLYYTLHNVHPEQTDHASGLINSHGIAEIADPAFFPLLKLEWPEHCNYYIPGPILSIVIREGIFHGRHIELCGMPHFGYLMCIAQRAPLNAALSSSERKVAYYFARGMTNKEIALELGTSPHTVRMQLKSVYRKLGVHNKIDLAHAIT